jgi:hypothetical protein
LTPASTRTGPKTIRRPVTGRSFASPPFAADALPPTAGAGEAAGSADAPAAGALDETAGALDETAGALDETAGALDETAGALDETAGALEEAGRAGCARTGPAAAVASTIAAAIRTSR